MNSRMAKCAMCDGLGYLDTGTCSQCGGVGKFAQRRKLVLTSTSRGQTFFRGALVSQKYTAKGTKR